MHKKNQHQNPVAEVADQNSHQPHGRGGSIWSRHKAKQVAHLMGAGVHNFCDADVDLVPWGDLSLGPLRLGSLVETHMVGVLQ